MADFFDEVDSLGIIERHIQGALQLESEKAQQMLSRYESVRSELRQRLDSARAGSFTAQQLRGTVAQVEGAITALTARLQGNMSSAAKDAALLGVEDLVTEIEKFQDHFQGAVVPINLNAQAVALDTANFLLTQYESSISAYGEALIRQLTGELTQAALMQMPYDSMVQRLLNHFDGEEWKLHRIVRTELHHVYSLGKLNGMNETQKEAIPDLMKTLIHPMDARTGADSKYAASLNLIANLDEPFEYKWGGRIRQYMAPPDRPNDRSILVPYRTEWNSQE